MRFIELIDTGSSNNWDSHGNMNDHVAAGQERRSADRRAHHRSEAPRDARRHAGRVDHRVRPHAVSSPNRTGREHHHRHSVRGWPAAASRRARPRRHRRIWHRRRRETGPRPRLPRHDPHLLGIDHERLTYRYSGRDYRLTDVAGEVVKNLRLTKYQNIIRRGRPDAPCPHGRRHQTFSTPMGTPPCTLISKAGSRSSPVARAGHRPRNRRAVRPNSTAVAILDLDSTTRTARGRSDRRRRPRDRAGRRLSPIPHHVDDRKRDSPRGSSPIRHPGEQRRHQHVERSPPDPRIRRDDWDRILAVDLTGVYIVAKTSSPACSSAGGGRIVNIASIAGLVPLRLQSAYVAAKAGVINLTHSMAVDWAREASFRTASALARS